MGSGFINPPENRYPAHSSNISWANTGREVTSSLQPSSISGGYREGSNFFT